MKSRPDVSRQTGKILLGNFRGSLVHGAVHDSAGRQTVGGSEGVLAREHLVGHHPQSEQVGSNVHRIPADLLRGHISRGASDQARSSQGRVVPHVRDAEAGQFHLAARGEEDVIGPDVPIHDPFAVGKREGIKELLHDVQSGRGVNRASADKLIEGLSLHQLHDQSEPFLVNISGIDADDPRVGETSGRLALSHEARSVHGSRRWVGAPRNQWFLDGHFPPQCGVPGPPDHSRGSPTKLRAQFIGAKGLRHGYLQGGVSQE